MGKKPQNPEIMRQRLEYEFKKKVEGEILIEQLNCVNQHIEFTSWMNRVIKGLAET